jgi:DNA-binding beta-propeller fold protein YncE
MKRTLAIVVMLGVALVAQQRGGTPQTDKVAPVNSGANPYRVIRDWAQLTIEQRPWGGSNGVAVDRDGKTVWATDRCSAGTTPGCEGSMANPVHHFDENGKEIKSFGGGLFAWPHGIHVDRDGNVWVTDGLGKDGKGHQVFKFSPEGKVLLTLGKAGVAGSGPDEFNAPSAVVVAPNGDFFVADGHGGNTNARIVKFSSDGKFIKAWGKKGSGPGEIDIPHAIAMDSHGRLFLGDRQNNRIQIFDQDGNYLDHGRSSAGRVACSSIRMTSSTSQTPNPNPSRRTMTDGSAASGSDA